MKYNVYDISGRLLGHIYAASEKDAVEFFREHTDSSAYYAKPHPESRH